MSTTQPRLAQLNGKGTLLVAGQMEYSLGAAIASANNLVTGSDGNVFHVTGSTQINLISGANWQAGAEVLLIFNSACVVKNLQTVSSTNYPIALFGNTDYDAGAGSVLNLFFDGGTWYDSRLGLTVPGTVNKVSSLPSASASNEGNFYLLNAAPAGTAYDTLVLAESSLIHYYKMNETSGTTTHDSQGSINGTNTSVTVNEPALGGDGEGSFYFNETPSTIYMNSAWSTWSNSAWTIEFLFKQTVQDNSYGNFILATGNSGSYIYITNNAENWFTINFSGIITLNFSYPSNYFTVALNTVYHCAFTWDGTNCKLYINGALMGTITPGYSPTGSGTARIGGTTSNAGGWYGYLSKVALYTTNLSGSDILAHYNAVFPAAATPDVMYVCEQNSLNVFAMRQVCDNLNFLPHFAPTGLTGAAAASRYVGATTGGPPASGTFAVGDHVIDQTGPIWVCTAAGSPGTWFPVGGTIAVNGQTGTTYSLALSDVGKVVEMNNASAITLTVTKDATVSWPLNALIGIFQLGAGQVTIAADTGVTLLSDGSLVHTKAQYASVSLRRRAANTWVLAGDLA